MKNARIALGLVLPLGIGFVFDLLANLGVIGPGLPKDVSNPGDQSGIPLSVVLASIAFCLVAGLLGGFLLRSLWAIASVPIGIVLGEVIGSFVTPGAVVVQDDALLFALIFPLIVIVLLLVALPAVPGAVVGALLGKRSFQ